MAVPRNLGRGPQLVLVGAALGQLVLAWVWPPTSPGCSEWLGAVFPQELDGWGVG